MGASTFLARSMASKLGEPAYVYGIVWPYLRNAAPDGVLFDFDHTLKDHTWLNSDAQVSKDNEHRCGSVTSQLLYCTILNWSYKITG